MARAARLLNVSTFPRASYILQMFHSYVPKCCIIVSLRRFRTEFELPRVNSYSMKESLENSFCPPFFSSALSSALFSSLFAAVFAFSRSSASSVAAFRFAHRVNPPKPPYYNSPNTSCPYSALPQSLSQYTPSTPLHLHPLYLRPLSPSAP